MDGYIAAIYSSEQQALSAHAQLAHAQGNSFTVIRSGVYGRDADGNVALVDAPTQWGLDLGSLSGAAQEAVDELNEKLPAGAYALLAHVAEVDESGLDEFAQQSGARLYRRSQDELKSTGFSRFTDATRL